ncbi:hypothetical protein [Nonomuraea sp. NPDC049400]|uniref:hypothetical protein n=1 Tax=Nonomuraea sp. NPDC049400 TaxID=3364352 RepID=UPI0037B78FE0
MGILQATHGHERGISMVIHVPLSGNGALVTRSITLFRRFVVGPVLASAGGLDSRPDIDIAQ